MPRHPSPTPPTPSLLAAALVTALGLACGACTPEAGPAKARAALAVNEADLEARWALGCALASRGDHAGALEQFLEIVTRSRKFKADAARLAMLALFDGLGPDSDLTRDYRRKLQIVL